MSSAGEVLSGLAPQWMTAMAWPVFWQSSLRVGALFVLDRVVRRRLRPAIALGTFTFALVALPMENSPAHAHAGQFTPTDAPTPAVSQAPERQQAIRIRLKSFAVPFDFTHRSLPPESSYQGPSQGILTASETSALRSELESNPGCSLLGEASVTTLSGRESQFQVQLGSEIGPQMPPLGLLGALDALFPPSNTNLLSQVGLTVDCSAWVLPKGPGLQIYCSVLSLILAGYDAPAPPKYDTRLIGGDAVLEQVSPSPYGLTAALPLPHFKVLKVPFAFSIPNLAGQTLFMMSPGDLPRSPGDLRQRLLFLLTPTLPGSDQESSHSVKR